MMPPRIRSSSFQAEAPEDVKGKWFFEVSMWTFDGEQMVGEPIGPFGPYDTQDIAIAESKKAAQKACESIETRVDGKPSGRYMDMKNGGVMRNWMEN